MNWSDLIVALVGAMGGGGTTFMMLRDKLNRSDTTAATEDAKQDFLKTLMAERDEAREKERECVDQRTLLAAEISRLKEANAASERERLRISYEYSSFKRLVLRLYPELEEYMLTHPAELYDPHENPKGETP